jgi:hypothetical protein
MNTQQRREALEAALPAQNAVRHWLAEAQAFGSKDAYFEWAAVQPDAVSPTERLRDQVEAAVWKAVPRGSADGPRLAWEARRDVVFLLELIDTLADRVALLAFQGFLRVDGLESELRCPRYRARTERLVQTTPGESSLAEDYSTWCHACALLAIMLEVAEQARTILEDHYLGRTDTLFPDMRVAWDELRTRVRALADQTATGDADGEDGAASGWPPDPLPLVPLTPEAVQARARHHAGVAVADLLAEALERTSTQFGDVAKAAQSAADRRRRREAILSP